MKKLFIVVNVDWFFLSHRKEIAVAAQANGYDVTIVTKDTGKAHVIKELGLKHIDLPLNRSGESIVEELGTLKFLVSLYRNNRDAIVHHVGLKTILWGTFAAKIAGVKGVVNAVSGLGIIFSEDNQGLKSKVIIQLMKYSHKQNNLKVIFQNDEDKAMFLKRGIINESACRFIKGSGVDLNQFEYTPEPTEGKLKVLFTARMIREKGVFVLADAANNIKDKFLGKVEFLLCGGLDDNPTALTKEDIESCCEEGYITWLGYRTDVLELLKDSHLVAFPSYYMEGLPKSLIEATAVGRPVITTDSIGCRDTVIDGYNGYLIPKKDSEMLGEKLELLLSDAQLRKEMGQNSRKYAEEHFSLAKVIEKHLSIYEELVKY